MQSLVAKYFVKDKKNTAFVCKKLYIFVLRLDNPPQLVELVGFFAHNKNLYKIGKLYTSLYFPYLQHFVTKLYNCPNFKMLF